MRTFAVVLLAMLLTSPLVASPASGQSMPRPLVVIDAGHGGVDPGARGPGGTLEKDIALAIARELASLLARDLSFDVRLTRDDDVLIPLHERPRLANQWRDEGGPDRPALFLSIHANAHQHRTARGYETYFLSEAITEDARRVAERENMARQFESPDGFDPLSFILNDLRQNLYLRESSTGAALIQRRMQAIHPGPDRGVKQAAFIVLQGAFMPAALVEIGFVSNPQEEAMLASGEFQRRIAVQLADGVRDFFSRSAAMDIAALP